MSNSLFRKMSGAIAVAGVIALLSACGGADKDASAGATSTQADYGLVTPGTITAATVAGNAPYSSVDASGKAQGMLIDLNDEIAKRLGLKTVYKTTVTESGLAGLTAGQFDILATSVVPNPERSKNVAFTQPIVWNEDSTVVPADSSVASIEDLTGKRVGASQGSAQYDYTKKNMPKASLVAEPTNAAGLDRLRAKNIDAFVVPSNLAAVMLAENPGTIKVAISAPHDSPSSMAINKKLTAFQKAYGDELAKTIDDGTFAALWKKYFSGVPYPDGMYKFWPQLEKQLAS